jgi:uncharacterized protein YdeI (YjbR/CyaY-like superfamily)
MTAPKEIGSDGLPLLTFPSAAAWETWLREQPPSSRGAWLKFAKKGSGVVTVSKQEALDAALCCGWIDGQLKPYNEQFWLVRFTPRTERSKWSQLNCERAERLLAEGRITAAGLEQIERAKADGRWEKAYAPHSRLQVPEDFQRALRKNRQAERFFAELDRANRYAILYRIEDASKPENRAAKIMKFIGMLERGETIHPPATARHKKRD